MVLVDVDRVGTHEMIGFVVDFLIELWSILVNHQVKTELDLDPASTVAAFRPLAAHSWGIRQSPVWNEYLDGVHQVDLAQPDLDVSCGFSAVILAPFATLWAVFHLPAATAKCSSENVDRDSLVHMKIDIYSGLPTTLFFAACWSSHRG